MVLIQHSDCMPPFATPALARRSWLVTLLGWLIILASAGLSVISFISFLMILAGSYGTQNTELSGFLLIVVAPPASFVAGIGLLRRWRWAWLYLVAGLLLGLGWQVFELTRPPRPAVTTTTLPNGFRETVYLSGPQFSMPLTAVLAGLLAFALTPGVRREFGISRKSLPPPVPGTRPAQAEVSALETERGWRVGHRGRDCMFYEERIGGVWQRIDLSGEMLMGRAHHVIYFPTAEAWTKLPEWARHRREEILARIQSEFREPDYDYAQDVNPPAVSAAPPQSAHASPVTPSVAQPVPPSQAMGLLSAVLFLAGVAIFMGWSVQSGIENGKISLPVAKGGFRHRVELKDSPALFWTSVGIHAALGAGSLLLAVWMTVVGLRSKRPGGKN